MPNRPHPPLSWRQMPRQDRGSSTFTALSSLCPTLPANACAHSKPVSGRQPLRCTRATGHDGDHGLEVAGVLVARWPA